MDDQDKTEKVAESQAQNEKLRDGFDVSNDAPKKKGGASKKKRKTRKKPIEKKGSEKDNASAKTKDDEAERCIKPKECSAGVPREIIWAAAMAFLVIAFIFVSFPSQDAPDSRIEPTTTTLKTAYPNTAQIGDIVLVDYIGSYENGTVFDTSIASEADDAGIRTALREYKPLMFTLGYGNLIRGFENAIAGMEVGQEKTISISPEDAYGYPSPEFVETVQRKQRSSATQNVSVERFIQEIGIEPEEGLSFKIPESEGFSLDWPLKVLSVTDDVVVFRYMAENRTSYIETVFGQALVYAEGDEIIIEIQAEEGQEIITIEGPAKIISVDEDSVVVDFNHPLAGKNLNFWIKLVEVNKQ